MPSHTLTSPWTELFEYLDGLTARASMAELRKLLRDLAGGIDDVQPWVRFSEDTYLRNLMREGRWYHALILCWRSGQRSPIHNHAGSTCGMRILQGVATETVFSTTPSGLIRPEKSIDQHEGLVSVSQDADIHQVSNLQEAGDDLVTLHIYSPPLLRMGTYSLTDPRIGEFNPMVLEHGLGSGI